MGIRSRMAANAEKDRKARENVEKLRQAKKKERGEDRINPALAKDLNAIQRQHGKPERF